MTKINQWATAMIASIGSVYRGPTDRVEAMLIALLCRGHVLIEDVPGVGKTLLARAVARAVGGQFAALQCTPDLLPSDVLGVSVYNPKTSEFVFRQGPVVTNVLLVDEINRATPRTQSALLEAMAEGQVSIEGRSIQLPQPFFLIATQSPARSEGTFPLPEVQKDRFFLSFSLGYPSRDSEAQIVTHHPEIRRALNGLVAASSIDDLLGLQRLVVDVHVEESIKEYIVALAAATRSDESLTLGVSPRGSLALFRGAQAIAAIRGRDYVVPEDVKDVAVPVLRQRILLRDSASDDSAASDSTRAERYIRAMLDRAIVPGFEARE